MAPASIFTGSTIKGIDHISFTDSRIHWIVYFRKFLVFVKYVEYGEEQPSNTASKIDERYSSYRINKKNKIYFFWTNGTLGEARQVWKHLVSKYSKERVVLLEETKPGKDMEDTVNDSLSEELDKLGYDKDTIETMKQKRELWPELFGKNVEMIDKHSRSCKNTVFSKTERLTVLKSIQDLKTEIEDYQKTTSEEYAAKANAKCFIIKFRRQGKKSGKNSEAEGNVLKKKHLRYHGFVAIANKKG